MKTDKYILKNIRTPYYIVDEALIERNLRVLRDIADRAGCKILLAQKAFSMHALYPLIGRYLHGTAASGLHEAKLGRECMGGEVHTFSAAFDPHDFGEIAAVSDYVIFNSLNEWGRYGQTALAAGCKRGLRVNPEHSTQDRAIYDPCAPGSRLGVRAADLPTELPEGITGLHFHTLCEQGADALASTLAAFEERFGKYLRKLEWVNFGGGHHITKNGYDVELLVELVRKFKEKYNVEVYLEPGEAVALDAGFLVTTVLDVVKNSIDIAILDASAACHMPDVLEMPYRPPLCGSAGAGDLPHTYRLAGPTCLSGDIIGDYSFAAPLNAGDRLVFGDMAIYTMVKNNTFNGMNLPSILLLKTDGSIKTIRTFSYDDFKSRL